MPEDINVQKNEAGAETERASGSKLRHSTSVAPDRKLPTAAIVIPIVALIVLGVGWYFFGPHKTDSSADRHAKPKNVPVTVAIAKMESVPIQIRTTGNIQPYSSVNIVPQVGGQIKKVYFTQGQNVRKGDPLFLIDPRPYQASLDQALGNVAKDNANVQAARANMARDQATVGQLQAALTKDQASLHYADVEYQRYKSLVAQGAISMEQADQTLTSDATASAQIEADKKQIENEQATVNSDKAQIDTAKATLEADKAVAENAKIQLEWCTIHAPIDGRTGQLQIYEGNVVVANNTTPIVNIAQVQPIYVQFTIPEEYLDQVRRCLSNGTLRIQAMIEGVATDYVLGSATFMDNTVNTTSGTALLRANFANTDLKLYPGQFVDVLVTMPPDGPSVVVPISAIQTTQKGNAVYVVQPDNTVTLNEVEMARSTDEWAAITSGIPAGATVVTDGQLQLTPGVSVKIVGNGSGKGGKRGKQSPGQNPDQGFNPASAGGGDDTAQSSDSTNALPTGMGTHGKAWNSDPGYGSQSANFPSLPSGSQAAGSQPPGPTGTFNPATNGGAPFHASGGASASPGTASGTTVLPGATRHDMGGGWHHRHTQ